MSNSKVGGVERPKKLIKEYPWKKGDFYVGTEYCTRSSRDIVFKIVKPTDPPWLECYVEPGTEGVVYCSTNY